jgi:excisionase family DNA binding protein
MTSMQLDPSYLTVAQVASMFGVTRQTIWRWRREFGLPCLQPAGPHGRVVFIRADVEAWICSRWNTRAAGGAA